MLAALKEDKARGEEPYELIFKDQTYDRTDLDGTSNLSIEKTTVVASQNGGIDFFSKYLSVNTNTKNKISAGIDVKVTPQGVQIGRDDDFQGFSFTILGKRWIDKVG